MAVNLTHFELYNCFSLVYNGKNLDLLKKNINKYDMDILNTPENHIEFIKENFVDIFSHLHKYEYIHMGKFINSFIESVIIKNPSLNYPKINELNNGLQNMFCEMCCVNKDSKCTGYEEAIKNNHLHCLQYLYLNDFLVKNFLVNGLIYACINGKFEIIKWIINNNIYDRTKIKNLQLPQEYHKFSPCYMKNTSIICACNNGSLEIAKFLHYELEITNIKTAFSYSCSKGFLDIAKWILDMNNDEIFDNINEMHLAFTSSCINNHLHIAKWLLHINKTPIQSSDITRDGTFLWSLQSGNFDVCNWLWNVNVICTDGTNNTEYYNLYKQCIRDIFKHFKQKDELDFCQKILEMNENIKNIILLD